MSNCAVMVPESLLSISVKENLTNGRKRLKKVSKYRDKDGKIKLQMQECKAWLKENIFSDEYVKIRTYCYYALLASYERKMHIKSRKAYMHRIKDLKNGSYLKSRLISILRKNRLYINKLYKKDGNQIYDGDDVVEFILLLCEAKSNKVLDSFLDIPDVFYILKQLKSVGISFYLS